MPEGKLRKSNCASYTALARNEIQDPKHRKKKTGAIISRGKGTDT